MRYLRQSATATILFGPAVSVSDGYTPVTTLASNTVDEVGVYKSGATSLTSLSATAMTHQAGGMYTIPLSVSNTDTLGHMRLYVRDDSACLPIVEEFCVLPQGVFDALIAGSSPLSVNTARVGNTVVAGPNDLKATVTAVNLASAEFNKIADHLLRRAYGSARVSANGDALDERSLIGALAKLVNRIKSNSGTGRLEIYHEDDTTVFYEQDYTTSASSDPITELDTTE